MSNLKINGNDKSLRSVQQYQQQNAASSKEVAKESIEKKSDSLEISSIARQRLDENGIEVLSPRLQDILEKISNGYYETSAVIDSVAEKMLGEISE